MKRFLLITLLFFLAGCTQAKQLAHLEQLMALKGVSDSREEQAEFVEAQNKKFEELLVVVKTDGLKEYPDKKSILKAFGEPVLARSLPENNEIKEEWLYRYATKYFNAEKVYLYFDAEGRLRDWQHVLPPAQKVASTTPIP